MTSDYFRHYKTNGIYQIITQNAKDSNTLEPLVVYLNIHTKEIWVRKKEEFFEYVSTDSLELVKRFTPVDPREHIQLYYGDF